MRPNVCLISQIISLLLGLFVFFSLCISEIKLIPWEEFGFVARHTRAFASVASSSSAAGGPQVHERASERLLHVVHTHTRPSLLCTSSLVF